jgi:predicted ATPase
MFLDITNAGKLRSAKVELNGITVIAGENDTGKSTVGKMLYCIANSFYKIDETMEKNKTAMEKNKISRNRMAALLFASNLLNDFDRQINHVNYPEKLSEITFNANNGSIKIQIENNDNDDGINVLEFNSLNARRIYIDALFVHQFHPNLCLNKPVAASVEEIIHKEIRTKRIEKILEKLNLVCPGKIIKKDNKFLYKDEKLNEPISAINMSGGFKMFAIIKTLLLNGSIEDNGILILDEPEVNLHPKWQLAFAELIVLIQKEFNLHVLLTTHSPYFLDAIEVYSRKHGITDKCKYYLAEILDDSSGMSEIFDVSDHIARVYEKLVDPLQKLEDERYSDR